MASEEKPSIKVIGAGLGRTGTKSLQAALGILGFKTYHFPPPNHAGLWAALAQKDPNVTSEQILQTIADEGFTATCDQPTADFYFEQMTQFPESKVVLTVRDNPQQWENSYRTLLNFIYTQEAPFTLTYPSPFQFIPFFQHYKTLRDLMGVHLGLPPGQLIRGVAQGKPEGWLGEQYEKHNKQVQEKVPEDRLLVFNVKEGWEPLCKFLGKPVPDQPFPRVNETKDIEKAVQVFRAITYLWIPAGVSFLSFILWFFLG
eukprot:CAMPEP_0201516584 /NCGR_PEP_ID=MMETSP0161_2-20130828/7880_1 /ASSEMBLY_ACC=CAM_ASM_000251 /TAXON_ID=180227 /ORGANISM="Neoparamoeba aestuarina, Strain SoJaBio B1-5/56/2" /LENGTH=257 /DNA_ID=CAMNT_0047913775 /DNA_START=144 /DNA_END=917 /DNA_ORIENTATION=+